MKAKIEHRSDERKPRRIAILALAAAPNMALSVGVSWADAGPGKPRSIPRRRNETETKALRRTARAYPRFAPSSRPFAWRRSGTAPRRWQRKEGRAAIADKPTLERRTT